MAKTFEITGIKEIDEVLKQLPRSLARSVLLATYKKAAKPLLEEMQKTVPQEQGDLQDSLAIQTGKATKNENVVVYVGPRNRPARKYVGWRAHLAEFGSAHHGAQPFIRPSANRKLPVVKENIRLDLATVLLRVMKRTIKKG